MLLHLIPAKNADLEIRWIWCIPGGVILLLSSWPDDAAKSLTGLDSYDSDLSGGGQGQQPVQRCLPSPEVQRLFPSGTRELACFILRTGHLCCGDPG